VLMTLPAPTEDAATSESADSEVPTAESAESPETCEQDMPEAIHTSAE